MSEQPPKPTKTAMEIAFEDAIAKKQEEISYPNMPTRAESQAALIEAVNKFPMPEESTERDDLPTTIRRRREVPAPELTSAPADTWSDEEYSEHGEAINAMMPAWVSVDDKPEFDALLERNKNALASGDLAEGRRATADMEAFLIKQKDLASQSAKAETKETESLSEPEKLEGKEESKEGRKWGSYLVDRAKKFDTWLAEHTESGFRTLGEKYNKLGWKSKLAVGLSLGIGAGALSAVSMPAAIACMGGIAVQRVAGLASAFLKYEKSSKDGKWQKEKAMGKAILQSALMTGAMLTLVEGVQEGIQYERGEQVHGWLHDNWPFGNQAAPEQPAIPTHESPMLKDLAHGKPVEAPAAAVAPAAPEVKVDLPTIDATEYGNRGYEGMLQKLSEQLHEQHLNPNDYPADSDIHQLLVADEHTIGKVAHDIASDSRHNFFHANGDSVRIDAGSHMTIGADNQIHMSMEGRDIVEASKDAEVTHAILHPHGAEAAHASAAPTPTAEAAKLAGSYDPMNDGNNGFYPDDTGHVIQRASDVRDDSWLHTNDPGRSMDPFRVEGSAVHVEQSAIAHGERILDNVVVNQAGLQIPMDQPHVYADAAEKHLFVYGGDPSTRAETILEYLKSNPDKTVYAASIDNLARVPWHLVEGEAVPGVPVRSGGLFGFSSFMKPPTPDELGKLIK